MILDSFHNKKIENYLTQGGKKIIKDNAKWFNENHPDTINDMKNKPNDFYNGFILKNLNDRLKMI